MKRVIDVCVSFAVLVLSMPLLVTLAILVRLKLGSPVFFVQERPGLGGQPFRMIKFRTMLGTHGSDGRLLADSERMTPFGRLLRSTSLDELPEFWNILRGDMSLVGPRPLLMQYLPRYSPTQYRRHEVKPGITGWAQIKGRNSLTWDEKFVLDLWYIDHHSVFLDFRILVLTVFKVLGRSGISASGEATMPEFLGTDQSMSTSMVSSKEDRK